MKNREREQSDDVHLVMSYRYVVYTVGVGVTRIRLIVAVIRGMTIH